MVRRDRWDSASKTASMSSKSRSPLGFSAMGRIPWAIMGKFPSRHASTFFQQGIHGLPNGEHIRMLVRLLKAPCDPGKNFDVRGGILYTAKNNRLGVGHQIQCM